MKLYNSLSDKVENFEPWQEGKVGVYTCGPTVYDSAHIGNFRTYVMSDVLLRVLKETGYEVESVMNLTDVGHLTGDNLGDASRGEDRMEKGSKREGLSAWELADKYIIEFKSHMKDLNIKRPNHLVRATEHIKEQIDLVKKLQDKGFVYEISDGLYFDTEKYEEEGYEYGELSTLDERKEGARVEVNSKKKNKRDFALWKFSGEESDRQMEWDSVWGKGFPGWHVECSAMSMKYLGEQFDVHVGGEDLRSTHHPNEVAQSEGVSGKKPFVKYWMHVKFLLVDGGRMGKSLGNAYTLDDLKEKGYDPLALRYFYLTGHYRKQLNFTFEGLSGAEKAVDRLRSAYFEMDEGEVVDKGKAEEYRRRFRERIEDDLDMPGVLALVWELVKSEAEDGLKKSLLEEFDRTLGLGLSGWMPEEVDLSDEVESLIKEREKLREENKWDEADEIRVKIEKLGYRLKDSDDGTEVEKIN